MRGADQPRLVERVGANLRTARLAAGLVQREVAESCGVDVPTVSKIERGLGNPTLGTLEKLARAVGIDPSMLLLPLGAGSPDAPPGAV